MFKTNIEVVLASEEEVAIYYETATRKVNLLLEKYNIRNARDEIEQVSADELQALLSPDGFFQSTPLKTIFFDQKYQYIPQEIIYEFRSILSNPPLSIKAIFFNTFLALLTKKGWIKPLSEYFEKHYDIPADSAIMLVDLTDYSLGFGVYKLTFQLLGGHKVVIFLKHSYNVASCNELLYFHLQKELLPTASYAKLPYRLLNLENKEELLLSPLVPGVASDTVLSLLTHTYQESENTHHRNCLKKAIGILIEAFISHAALGDLLGRNDRHLMNSLIAPVVDGMPQVNTIEHLMDTERILSYANSIITKKTRAISLIDIDLNWLLDEQSAEWALVDIDFGLSELNLLSLLVEFNDYDSEANPFFEQRKQYIKYYFNVYCQELETILAKKELLFAAIKSIYPADILQQKLHQLTQRITLFEKSRQSVVELFERYLSNFRIRFAYKATLTNLVKIAKRSNNLELSNALKEAGLLQYLPYRSDFNSQESSVFNELQCFRGVLSQKDTHLLSSENRATWEGVASHISRIAKKFNSNLFEILEHKIQFIRRDTAALLELEVSTILSFEK